MKAKNKTKKVQLQELKEAILVSKYVLISGKKLHKALKNVK